MKLFNSLTRKVEEIEPISAPKVGVYTCGPTVYDYVTIGNWRTYTLGDMVVRVLRYFGYDVMYIMNITDVGHFTGDNLGDADTGEDRLEKGAKREGRSAWDIAEFYTNDFYQGYEELNLVKPQQFCKATDHIEEQIALVQQIEAKGFTYQIDDGIYFNTKKYEKAGYQYGVLSTLDSIQAGARVEPNPQKKDPRDFGLWKFSLKGEKRQMEWPFDFALPEEQSYTQGKDKHRKTEIYISKDGKPRIRGYGFPGWHVECSAMSMKYLGEQFDIHIGGEDLRSTHHPNEIAQTEAATDKKPFVKYWVHGAFLQVDGGRMGKSLGNAYTLADIKKRGFDPLALRYFYFSGHYRKKLNFTWEALESAQTALLKLRAYVSDFKNSKERTQLSTEKLEKLDQYKHSLEEALIDDLKFPEVLRIVWEVVKSNIPSYDKYDFLVDIDQLLGLKLADGKTRWVTIGELPAEVKESIEKRERFRKKKNYDEADKIRGELLTQGYLLEDTADGVRIISTEK